MKILVSSYHNPQFLAMTEFVENAIRKLGHELIKFDDRQFLFPNRLHEKATFMKSLDLNILNKRLLSLAAHEKPDLCLVLGGHRIQAKTIQRIQDRGAQTILWTVDAPLDFDPVRKGAKAYHKIFCGGTEAIELLGKEGIQATWLPFAYDATLIGEKNSLAEQDKKYDLSFIGSYYRNRLDILQGLSLFNLNVWGPGWRIKTAGLPFKEFIRGDALRLEDWSKIYQETRISLVIHYQDGKTPCYQVSPKLYEALACRSFVLIDDQKDARELFKDKEHVVYFHDMKDLKQKINYYLRHPEEREAIAERGYRYVQSEHTYEHRLKYLLHTISKEKELVS